jgi:CDP-4-dehydro-6-deoxyglucose reductase
MSFTVTVEPSGQQFSVEPGETILSAADRHGLALPYGCRNGVCGSCASQIVSGGVVYPDEKQDLADARPETECLTCMAEPASDVTLKVDLPTAETIEVKPFETLVEGLDKLAHDVMRVYLRLPEGKRLQFLAGQYLDFILPDGRRRAFSIANAPHNDQLIELHIRHVPGGEFTDYVFDTMKVGDKQNIEAPLGNFYLREDSDRPMVFMAGGTGFAPLKGIIQHALQEGIDRPMHIYWGVRAERDLYLNELAEEWAERYPHIDFTSVLSEPDENWRGATGWVHDAVLADHPEMGHFDLYMSGPPPMVFAAKKAFMAAGLHEDHMFSDVFEWAQDTPGK